MTRPLRHAGTALVAAVALLGSLLVYQGTASAAGPVVHVTSPAAASAVKGVWTLSADVVPDAGDLVTSAVLQLDGTPVPAPDTCTGSDQPCTLVVSHDFTGGSGSHTVTVLVTTGLVTTAVTDSVTFTVTSPAPTATISTTPVGATQKGRFGVTYAGQTDATQTGEFVQRIELLQGATLGTASLVTSRVCPGAQRNCSQAFTFDATTLPDGPLTLWSRVTSTAAPPRTAAANVALTVANPPPTTSITDPVGGTTVSGTVVVTATASTASPPLSSVPAQIQLLADGVVVDTQPCVGGKPDCSLKLTWDATGLTGDHVLTTRVTTTLNGVTAESTSVTVTVTTPPFDVAITSPVRGAVIAGVGATTVSSGIVPVSISASTNVTQTEFPTLLELLVDGTVVGGFVCAGSPVHACVATLSWDARKAAGLHRLAARVTTSSAHSATSGSVSVFARSGSRVAFFAPPTDVYGGYTVVRGRVASTTSRQPLVGVAVRLVLAPSVGRARTFIVRTGVGGVFSLRTRYYSNTTVYAGVSARWLVRGAAKATQHVRAPMVCSTASSSVRRGATGRGVCVVRNLPAGTVVRLRYAFRGRWFTLATGRSRSASVAFTFRFVARGRYVLQVSVGTSRVYVATAGRAMPVTVR